MQKLTDDFKAKNPGIDLEWVTLEENVLRQKVRPISPPRAASSTC
jgi:sorbitol/mannitol transport system substrate-binding protein